MQNSHLLNSKKYFLLFFLSAFFFIFNIHAAEDEIVKIKNKGYKIYILVKRQQIIVKLEIRNVIVL